MRNPKKFKIFMILFCSRNEKKELTRHLIDMEISLEDAIKAIEKSKKKIPIFIESIANFGLDLKTRDIFLEESSLVIDSPLVNRCDQFYYIVESKLILRDIVRKQIQEYFNLKDVDGLPLMWFSVEKF